MNFNDDCRNVTKEHPEYDYVFTSPPDFKELELNPKDTLGYSDFLAKTVLTTEPKRGIITVAFTDRKNNGRIVPKSTILKNLMHNEGWELLSHKIWVKSIKINMYRLNYGNVLSFGRGKFRQNQNKEFKPDVWMDGTEEYKGFAFGMPVDVPRKCILNYTQEGDTVYDPFMGSGTTAIASLMTNRLYQGAEMKESVWNLSQERVSEFHNRSIVMQSF